MTADDMLAKLTVPDPHTVRAWIVKITGVTPTQGYCTIDPQDGELVTEVPYWGSAPAVGSVQVALLFDGLLGVVSTSGGAGSLAVSDGLTGTGTPDDPIKVKFSGVWGQGSFTGVPDLDSYGANPGLGQPVYLDSQGNLRTAPNLISSPDARTAAQGPGSYPVGLTVMSITQADAAAKGWPYGASCSVVTTRRDADYDSAATAAQWWYRGGINEVWYRAGYAGTSWQPWVVVLQDAGWIPITILPGFAATNTNEAPSVRLKNGIVYTRGAFINTGITAINTNYTVGNLPAGYRPVINTMTRAGTSTGLASAALNFYANGDVIIRTGSTLSNYYFISGHSWPID